MNSEESFARQSKRETSPPYYPTGELLPTDTSVSDSNNIPEIKTTPNAGRRRLPNLQIIPPDTQQFAPSPLSSQCNATLASSASYLRVVFSDMLHSPASAANACPESTPAQNPPAALPRCVSVPCPPRVPVELPGIIRIDNQGLSPCLTFEFSTSGRPLSHNFQWGAHPSENHGEDQGDLSALLCLFPKPLSLAESNPDRNVQCSTIELVCGSSALNLSATAKPNFSEAQQKQCSSDVDSQKHSNQSALNSPSFTSMNISTSICGESDINSSQGRVGTSRLSQPLPSDGETNSWERDTESLKFHDQDLSVPTPTSTSYNKQIAELKATIATQDQTIFTLQAQFSSLRASHEAHIARFTEMQAAEVASLKNYARVLEEQLSQRPSLHHASSTDLLFLLDTVESQTPTRESSRHSPDTGSTTSVGSFPSALDEQKQSLQRLQNSPEMENLKRRLSTSRRPDTANRNLLPELNQYKQNNVALQKQIESLMAKLSESKKNEKALKNSLEDCEYRCTQWQDQAVRADKIAKTGKAMQKTIDSLENRLKIANSDKLDAEEQLFNLRMQQSSFNSGMPRLQDSSAVDCGDAKTQGTRMSFSSVLSTELPDNSQESTTIDIFIAHIERLEDIIRQQDEHVMGLEGDNQELRQRCIQLEQENNESNLQLDIQNELIRKTKQTDMHLEELRTAIVDRESIIEEKEKSIRLAERQLEHHKLLLQAEIRKHAKMTLHAAVNDEPLPELSTLAAKEEIDKWIDKLNQRLKKEKPLIEGPRPTNALEAQVEDLRQEIDFYVREIIYYKLDIRGYKSDIKKLKRITTQLSTYGSRASDLESDTSSLRPTPTPSRLRFPPMLDASLSVPPVPLRPMGSMEYPETPPPSASTTNSTRSANPNKSTGQHISQQMDLRVPPTPHTPRRKSSSHAAGGSKDTDHGVSPRSVARLSPDRRKPAPLSRDWEKFGGMLTNFSLSTPASPEKCDMKLGISGSTVHPDTSLKTVETGPALCKEKTPNMSMSPVKEARKSIPSNPKRARTIPKCPSRPQYGLFDFPPTAHQATDLGLHSPPYINALAEAFQKSFKKTS